MISDITDSAVAGEVRMLESAINNRADTSDGRSMSAILFEEFCEFGMSGRIWSRAETLELLKNAPPVVVRMRDIKVIRLAEATILLTYLAERAEVAGAPTVQSMRSSIWTRIDDQWRLVFRQGTAAQASMPDIEESECSRRY